jgi:hypothetical protein
MQPVNDLLIIGSNRRGLDHQQERCLLDLFAKSYSIVVARFVLRFDYDLSRWLASILRAAIFRCIFLRPLPISGTPSLVNEQECQPLHEANDGLLIGGGRAWRGCFSPVGFWPLQARCREGAS